MGGKRAAHTMLFWEVYPPTVSDGCCADAWRGRGGDVTMAFLLLFCSFALQGSEGTLFVAVRERSIAVLAAERGPVSYLPCTLIN